MNSYQEVAVENGRDALDLDGARTIARMLENEALNNNELVALQNALRLYASKTHQVLQITDGGAMYITDDHMLGEAKQVIRLV